MTIRSFTHIATRSMPIVSYLFKIFAISIFVPIPSVLATIFGFFIFFGILDIELKLPILESTNEKDKKYLIFYLLLISYAFTFFVLSKIKF